MENLERILSAHPFFEELDRRYLPLLVGCASNVRFHAGEFIFHEGEEADRFYLIREGKVSLEVCRAPAPADWSTYASARAKYWAGRG